MRIAWYLLFDGYLIKAQPANLADAFGAANFCRWAGSIGTVVCRLYLRRDWHDVPRIGVPALGNEMQRNARDMMRHPRYILHVANIYLLH
jgi:hypothetical protein